MDNFSLHFFDRSSRPTETCKTRARDVWQAMSNANRRLYTCFRKEGIERFDPRGRVDVLDSHGAIVARIYCAEAITAMS